MNENEGKQVIILENCNDSSIFLHQTGDEESLIHLHRTRLWNDAAGLQASWARR